MEHWITVPTYWDTSGGKTPKTRFDHPTSLNEEGTMARMLESFKNLNTKAPVLIILGTNAPDPHFEAHKKVESILKPFAKAMDIFLVSESNLQNVNGLLSKGLLSLDGYGNIRNVQHAIPYLMGAQSVVGIDDDEIITDAYYLDKVLDHLGKPLNGDVVGGMAGPYFNGEGEYRLADASSLANEQNIFLKKNYYMNAALEKVMEPPQTASITKSNVAFGGNMCVTRSTIEKVCHDPYILRGEDYDYVATAMMEGINFYFHPHIGIVHLPPDSTGSQAGDNHNKLECDIRRFIYVREKYYRMADNHPGQPAAIEDFMPYPGVYLDKGIDMRRQGVEALVSKYPGRFSESAAEDVLDEAIRIAKDKIDEFMELHCSWKVVLPAAAGDEGIRECILDMKISVDV